MKTKIIFAVIFLFSVTLALSQNYPPQQNYLQKQSGAGNEIDYSTSQIIGYSCVGIGALTTGYTAFSHDENIKNPTFNYVIGGALLTAGIGLLVFGNKDKKEPKYWKGMSFKNENINVTFALTNIETKIIYRK